MTKRCYRIPHCGQVLVEHEAEQSCVSLFPVFFEVFEVVSGNLTASNVGASLGNWDGACQELPIFTE